VILNMLHRIWKNRVKESSIKCRESGILPSVRVQNPVTYRGILLLSCTYLSYQTAFRTYVRMPFAYLSSIHINYNRTQHISEPTNLFDAAPIASPDSVLAHKFTTTLIKLNSVPSETADSTGAAVKYNF
jgi:hypothetical protein